MQTHTPEEQDDFLDMPDDQIMGMSAPPAPAVIEKTPEELAAESAQATADAEAQRIADEAAAADTAAADEAAKAADEALKATELANEAVLNAPDDKVSEPVKKVESAKPGEEAKEPTPEEKTAAEEAAKKLADEEAAKLAAEEAAKNAPPVLTVEEKAAALDSLMTFKANGKEIKLNSHEELLKLAQMGAGYTRKMQQLQPSLRLITMLNNNKLTDPNQLAYLIDLAQGKPEAIQKLLVDSKFDLHSVDTEKAAQYKPGPHQVTDSEMQFATILEEVESSETGKQLITEVTEQWDGNSRRALFQDPRLLSELNTQKANGLYGLVTTELERRKVLGEFQAVPFLIAYQQVGEDLAAKGLLKIPNAPAAPAAVVEPPKREPVEQRVVAPPAKVVNSEAAKAASAPKADPKAVVKKEENFLDMPDDQFLKDFQGRL